MKENVLITFGTRFLSGLFSFLLVIVLSQILGADGKGEATLILTTVALIILFCDFIGGAGLIYLTSRKNIFQLLFISYFWSILISLSAYIAVLNTNFIGHEYAIHISIISFLQSITQIHGKVLMGKEDFKTFNLIILVQITINLLSLLSLFYIFNQQTVFSYILSLYISSLIALVASFFAFRNEKFTFSFEGLSSCFKTAFRYGFYNQTANLSQFLNYRLSFYFLQYYWGDKVVGIYSNGASLAESIWIITNSITLVQLSKISNSDNSAANKQLTTTLSKYILLATGIPTLILVFLPASFYQFVFGEQFGPMAWIIPSLAPGILLYNYTKVISHYFSGTGRFHYNMGGAILGLAITVLAGFILIPAFPVTGAGITATLSYFGSTLFLLILFIQKEKVGVKSFIPSKNDFVPVIKEAGLFLERTRIYFAKSSGKNPRDL